MVIHLSRDGLHAYGLVGGDAQPQLDGGSCGDALPLLESQELTHLAADGPDLVAVGALPPPDAVALSVAALQVYGYVYIAGAARVVGEGLHVLAETAPVVHDVQGEAKLASEPFQVGVDARRFPLRVGEYGAVGDAVERALACHERHDGGLDASAQADDGQGSRGPHQPSSPAWSSAGGASEGESSCGARACSELVEGGLSLVAYLTRREKMRLSLSSASGPGLYLTSATLDVRGVPAGSLRFLLSVRIFHIASLCSIGPVAGRTESLRSPYRRFWKPPGLSFISL